MISVIGIYVILFIHAAIGESLGFLPVESNVYFFITTFYVVGLFASLSCAFGMSVLSKGIVLNTRVTDKYYGLKIRKNIINITVVVSLICCFFIYKGWSEVGSFVSDDFEGTLTYGIAGHFFAILVALIPFLLKAYYSKRTKSVFLLLVFVLVLLFMKQVKYWVMIPLVWMFWYSIVAGYIKLSIRKFLFISLILAFLLVSLFFSVYFMKVFFREGSENVDYNTVLIEIMIHFFGYLYSGLLTFSVYISDGLYNAFIPSDILGLFSGPVNIINVILNDDLINLTLPKYFVVINKITGTTGNVPTLWGTLLLAGGYYAYIFYFFMFYCIYLLLWFAKRSQCFLIIYTFITSFLFFSWFDYYYYLLMPFEVTVLILIFYTIFERKIKFRNITLFSGESCDETR
ncbi:DUF6337 family protein [Cronobacter sakazakii]|nr:DUF6337 family protein [Cronobacter sakazakii]